MSEQNKAIERRLLDEVYSQGNLDVIDELVACDFVGHGTAADGGDQGREAYKHFVVEMRTAFPDLQITVEDQIAEGDKVVTRWRARGTHTGTFQGIPPPADPGRCLEPPSTASPTASSSSAGRTPTTSVCCSSWAWCRHPANKQRLPR